MTENSKKVLEYVKSVGDQNITAADIAEALGLTRRQADGVVTAFTRKLEKRDNNAVMQRVEREIELEDGTHKKVKFIKLTEYGKTFEPAAEDK